MWKTVFRSSRHFHVTFFMTCLVSLQSKNMKIWMYLRFDLPPHVCRHNALLLTPPWLILISMLFVRQAVGRITNLQERPPRQIDVNPNSHVLVLSERCIPLHYINARHCKMLTHSWALTMQIACHLRNVSFNFVIGMNLIKCYIAIE